MGIAGIPGGAGTQAVLTAQLLGASDALSRVDRGAVGS